MQNAEIIAIGSELLTPSKTDTNSLWLTKKLNEIGIEVKLKTIVGDDEACLEQAVNSASKRADILITTGGLGPTEDDITRKIVARALNSKLIFEQTLLDELHKKFARYGYQMPERNRSQAYIIEGSEALPNPNGSAVGMIIERENRIIVVLPGPPREMKPMFRDYVLPRIKDAFGGVVIRRKILRIAGVGESVIDEQIAPIYTQYTNPETAILFNNTEVLVEFKARAETVVKADQILKELADKVIEKLGVSVFSEDGSVMEEVIAKLLIEEEATVATAESCTGGLIGMRLTDIAGSSAYFLGGAVTYSNDEKIRSLGVSKKLLKSKGAVSAEIAEEMAAGIREKTGATYALSVTGIAGPEGGTEEKPVGTVFIALADKNGTIARRFVFPGDRSLIRWRSSQAALELLRRHILKRMS